MSEEFKERTTKRGHIHTDSKRRTKSQKREEWDRDTDSGDVVWEGRGASFKAQVLLQVHDLPLT